MAFACLLLVPGQFYSRCCQSTHTHSLPKLALQKQHTDRLQAAEKKAKEKKDALMEETGDQTK